MGSYVQPGSAETASALSASIGESFAGSGSTGPVGASSAAGMRSRAGRRLSASTGMPDSTDSPRAVTSPVSTNRSLCLIRSQLLRSEVRTSANEPLSFTPRRKMLSLPFSRPARTRRSASARSWKKYSWPSSGEYAPQSQTITSPAPYCFSGITPSKDAYSNVWSSVGTASRLSAGFSDGPFGTAHDFSTPSASSRKSKWRRRAACCWTTKSKGPGRSGAGAGLGSGVTSNARLVE